jgi:type II secretory pathway component GspD/PulD (secretin)
VLSFDDTGIKALLKKFKNNKALEEILEVEFLQMLSNVSANTVGQENHRFQNRSFLLEGSVNHYIQADQGYIVSEGLEYNEKIYYGSEKFETSWSGDPWIANVWERDKGQELETYRNRLVEELNGYFT